MIFLFLACVDDTEPSYLEVTPDCPASSTVVLERLGEPVTVDLCQWDGVGWWCDAAAYTLGRDWLVVDCEDGGQLRVGWLSL